MKLPQSFTCDACNQLVIVDWQDWSDQVLVFNLQGVDVRICKECQQNSNSFKRNALRLISETIKK